MKDRVRLERQVQEQGTAPAEFCLREIPAGVHVKLDECPIEFMEPEVCAEHCATGYVPTCPNCKARPGRMLVQPLRQKFTYKPRKKSDGTQPRSLTVHRTQLTYKRP